MDVYQLLKVFGKVPGFVKLAGVWGMYVSRRRCIGIFLDPVLACNLRCRMCLFSTDAHRATMKGIITDAQLDRMQRVFFPHALKLQIGCGAEPTLYPRLRDIVERGKASGIANISLVTNGQLIGSGRVSLPELVRAGLSELTLSMHGTNKETYEYLMPGADFALLLKLIAEIARTKAEFPAFRVRINFTVNSMNLHDLEGDKFWSLWPEGVQPDVIQMRPVQNLGDSQWTDFDPRPLKEHYDTTFGAMAAECRSRGIVCIMPEKHQIDEVATPQGAVEALIEDFSYCYLSPDSAYKSDFDLTADTFRGYHRRHRTARRLFRAIFTHRDSRAKHVSKKLNYTVR